MGLLVVRAGPMTLVQDAGRPGLASQGVGRAGAFDRRAATQVHQLLGDGPGAAVLEVLGGGLVLEAEQDHRVAVTGGIGPLDLDGRPAAHGRVLLLRRGARLTVGPLTHGMRAYVGVAGGLDVPAVLGSRSTDLMSRLGPPVVSDGDRLGVQDGGGRVRHLVASATGGLPEQPDVPALLTPGAITVDVVPGPRDDWFTAAALRRLLSAAWEVSARSDRIGVRLEGPTLDRAREGELPSEPCVRGSVQVTSAGQPVVLGPDHPVTGGYPVIGVVVADGVDRLGQARPGETVRLRRSTAS